MMESAEEPRGAIVTGGSRGIGAEIARQLCDAGHRVVITGREPVRLKDTAQRVGATHIVSDVSEPGEAARVVEAAVEELGRLDLLVNNAGTSGEGGPLLGHSTDDWWEVVRTNLYGPMAFMHAALSQMVEQGSGLIINIGSYGGVRPLPGASSYGVSKAALARLTDSVAAEVEGSGVVLLCVSPGLVDTDMTRAAGVFDDLPAEAWDPIERIGQLVCDLVRHPDVHRLSGRFIHVRDDIERILERMEQVEREGLYRLGLRTLDGLIA